MRILGLDIGGANIKAATNDGAVRSLSFPMWKQKEQLSTALTEIASGDFSEPVLIAVTMTAELADCFLTKAEGVEFIIESVISAFPNTLIRVWLTSGEFAEPADAIEIPSVVAASNWHALATWAARAVPDGPAMLIDVGSTTTDIIPLLNGLPAPEGLNDLERLASHELVYTGATRTPVCAVVRTVPLNDVPIPLAAELFATTADIHRITGDLPESSPSDSSADTCATADGRPATVEFALNRLAHMLCCDRTELTEQQLHHVAQHVADSQIREIAAAAENRLTYLTQLSAHAAQSPTILVSGSGHFLATKALAMLPAGSFSQVLNLSQMFNNRTAESACAFAVARLAADRCLDDLLPLQPFHPATEHRT